MQSELLTLSCLVVDTYCKSAAARFGRARPDFGSFSRVDGSDASGAVGGKTPVREKG